MLQITLKEIALLIALVALSVELFKTTRSNQEIRKKNEMQDFGNRFIYDPIGYKIKSPPPDVILPELDWDPNEPDLETMLNRLRKK
jgi:hypothetical protein